MKASDILIFVFSKFTKVEKKTMPKEASSSRPFLGPINKEVMKDENRLIRNTNFHSFRT